MPRNSSSSSSQHRRSSSGRSGQSRSRSSSGGSSSGRGFAALSSRERSEIAARGGRASHGGRGRDQEGERSFGRGRPDYDDQRGDSSARRGFAGMEPDRQREFASRGGRASHSGSDRDYDAYRSPSRGRSDHGDERGSWSGRGFAGMDPNRQREIASRGGRASHGGQGRDYDDAYRSSFRGRSDNADDQRGGNSSRRGFAGMDPDRQREFASRGGRASHGGGRDYDDYPEGQHSGSRWSDERGYDDDEDYSSRGRHDSDDDDYDDEDFSSSGRGGDDHYDYEVRERGRSMDDDQGPRGARRGSTSWDEEDLNETASRGERGRHRYD